MMRLVFCLIFLVTCVGEAIATRPATCFKELPSQFVVTSKGCEEGMCGFTLAVPREVEGTPILGMTLIVGDQEKPEFRSNLEYQNAKEEGFVDIAIYYAEGQLANFQIFASYGVKDKCSRHMIYSDG